jgi:ATP-dependent DNA ligase
MNQLETIELVSRTVNNKIKVLRFNTFKDENKYVIDRYSFQYKGKETKQPSLIIEKGKAKRTLEEQFNLELNSLIKRAIDKGYKRLTNSLDSYNEKDIQDYIGSTLTNNSGNLKVQLAKQADKITNYNVFDKQYLISRKINGVRSLIFKDETGKIRTSSRGAINYDIAIKHIIEHPIIIDIFNKYPTLIMDGEIYKHGLDLNDISGMCRKQEESDTTMLEFYWYDIFNEKVKAIDRINTINNVCNEYNLTFNPYRTFTNEVQIQQVPQELITGYENMKAKHDQFVSEGWEGAVIRLCDGYYTQNGRTNDMIKIKKYDTISCKVVGIEQGLREYADMVFICQMPDSDKTFKAKPLGNYEQKVDYTIHFEDTYKNHMADIKYFNYSAHGVLEQPCLTVFRWDLD